MVKRRRSHSPNPPEATPPSGPSAQPSSPSAFPELLGSAKRFAVTSPKASKLNSASPHRSMLGKPASPTIQQLFSRQAASQSPAGAKTSSAPASAAVKSRANPAVTDRAKLDEVSRCVKGREPFDDAVTAAQKGCLDEQQASPLVKQAVGILSEVVNSSAAGRALLRSIKSTEKAGQPRLPGATATGQSSSPVSPDESSTVQQTSGADERALDLTSPARGRDRSGSLSRSTDLQGGQTSHTARVGKARRRQNSTRQFSGRESIAAAEVIDLVD